MAHSEDYTVIKKSVDSILNVSSVVRRKKKQGVDKKKEMFVEMVTKLEEAAVKSTLAYADLQLDLSKYDEKFYAVIDVSMVFAFGQACTDIINYYVWDRMASDGSIVPLVTQDGREIYLNNAYELWEVLILINPKIIG